MKIVWPIELNQKLLIKYWNNTGNSSAKFRPLGVTIIAILAIIVGIANIVFGIGPLAFAAFFPELGAILIATGSILIAIGIGYLVVSYGLMKGKGWAWSITLILSYISIVVGIVSLVGGNILSIIPIIISGVIIWYLYKQEIKRFFGKSADAKI